MSEKAKKTEQPTKKVKEQKDLSEAEIEQLMDDLENFDNSFLSFLAGTQSYEVVPTSDDMGNNLQDKHYELIKKECNRMNVKIIYSVDLGKNITLLFCPDTKKFGVVNQVAEVQ